MPGHKFKLHSNSCKFGDLCVGPRELIAVLSMHPVWTYTSFSQSTGAAHVQDGLHCNPPPLPLLLLCFMIFICFLMNKCYEWIIVSNSGKQYSNFTCKNREGGESISDSMQYRDF